jgi:hypothetical protein
MPIPNPILDDRSYQQLRDELVQRIPVFAREWTDHNPTDPGVTLIELFAHLGENLLYRFNQIPEAARLAFLRLLQIPLRPATPSRAVVTLSTAREGGVLVPLGSELRAGDLPFQTRTEVHVWPVTARAVAKSIADAPVMSQEPDVYEFALRTLDAMGDLDPDSQAAWFQAKALDATGAGPPVDFSATVDHSLWVAVVRDKEAKGHSADLGKSLLNIGFVPDPEVLRMEEVAACPGEGTRPPRRPVEWRVFRGEYEPDGKTPVFHTAKIEGDTTDGLSREGVVRLRLPSPLVTMLDPNTPKPDADLEGTGDRPPTLPDEDEAKRVLFWLRAFRTTNSGFGKVLDVTANAIEVRQVAKARPEFLGTGTGQADQRYRLVHRPVVADSLVLQVEEAGGWRTWRETDGFFAVGPEARAYTLDHEAAEVRFGTALRGMPPQIGQRVRANEYLYGGGAAGNVPPKAIAKLAVLAPGGGKIDDVKKVENRQRAHGGADGESVPEALARIPAELRRRDRAVTRSDFQELALMTPGADVARADCLPRFHPPTRTGERPGIVTVVVWPREDPRHPNAPVPDRDTLRAVCEWLDSRRLVTTELYVIPPTYVRIAAAVGVKVKDGYGTEAVRRWVELILRQYLAPLPPYGPAGQGWPLGRKVYGPELEAAALQVEGVEYLEGNLRVGRWDEVTKRWVELPANQTPEVTLEVYEVPQLDEVVVSDAPPGDLNALIGPPPSDKTPVPVPVIRQEC